MYDIIGNSRSYKFDHLPDPGLCRICGTQKVREKTSRIKCPECSRKFMLRNSFLNGEKLAERARLKREINGRPPRKKKHYLLDTWNGMHDRCYNTKSRPYKWYGGRGIGIHELWRRIPYRKGIDDPKIIRVENRKRFLNFVNYIEENLGSRPEGSSLDRYPDRNGNYEPGNVRWSTVTEQNRNKNVCILNRSDISENEIVRVNNRNMTLREISDSTGINLEVIKQRWAVYLDYDLITDERHLIHRRFVYKGCNYTGMELSYIANISYTAVRSRISLGWTPEEIVETPTVKYNRVNSKSL